MVLIWGYLRETPFAVLVYQREEESKKTENWNRGIVSGLAADQICYSLLLKKKKKSIGAPSPVLSATPMFLFFIVSSSSFLIVSGEDQKWIKASCQNVEKKRRLERIWVHHSLYPFLFHHSLYPHKYIKVTYSVNIICFYCVFLPIVYVKLIYFRHLFKRVG